MNLVLVLILERLQEACLPKVFSYMDTFPNLILDCNEEVASVIENFGVNVNYHQYVLRITDQKHIMLHLQRALEGVRQLTFQCD